MKRLFVTLALFTYAGMAAYSLGTMNTRASSSLVKSVAKPTPKATPRIMLVTANLSALADFYNEVFAADLQPLDESAAPNYQGKLGGRTLVLAPKQNGIKPQRQRLSVEVTDIAETLLRVTTTGGTVDGKMVETETEKRLVVRDPDGNLIELTQKKG